MTIQSPPPQNSDIQAEIVLPFSAINLSSLPIVGGKAANLGEMIHAGLPVPPGFCITTTAYALVAEGSKIDPILAELVTANPNDKRSPTKLVSLTSKYEHLLIWGRRSRLTMTHHRI